MIRLLFTSTKAQVIINKIFFEKFPMNRSIQYHIVIQLLDERVDKNQNMQTKI